MSTYREEVRESFSRMDSEELIERARTGNLTSTAQEIVAAELSRRGISLDRLPVESTEEMPLKPKAWVRFWARMFDLYVFEWPICILLVIVASRFNPKFFGGQTLAGVLVIMMIFVGWVFIEALTLSLLGTTPGKWLFRIKLTHVSGKRLSWAQALSRSLKVWWRGLGANLPIISFFTLVIAYEKLKKNAVTSWDREGSFAVTHGQIGALRILTAVACFIPAFVLERVVFAAIWKQ